MFIYHIHVEEAHCPDNKPCKTDIYFQAKGIINLYEMTDMMNEFIDLMYDCESELYDECCDLGWYERVDKAFELAVQEKYYDAQRIEVYTANVEFD